MLKTISIFILIFAGCFYTFAQTEKYTAPVKWERYKVSDKDVSILFPKLPVLRQTIDACGDGEIKEYATYAGGIVYALRVISNLPKNSINICGGKKSFDEKNFESRLEAVKLSLKSDNAVDFARNNMNAIKVKGDLMTYWLIKDFKNKRWFELWTTAKDEADAVVNNFVESFRIEKNPTGIEIGKGADRTLGDEQTDNLVGDSSQSKSSLSSDATKDVRIVFKPIPPYTDAARRAQVQGTVKLRITFLASGGIGDIETLSELPLGLTEQVISVAKKIIFIPAKEGGINVTSAKNVEYSFSVF